VAADRERRAPVAGLLRASAGYVGTTVGLCGAFALAYFGRAFGDYAAELAAILSSLNYAAPFPALGEPGLYVGFNEFYWLQLPWLVTAVFVLWWLVAGRERAPDGAVSERRRTLHALFVCFALGSFVIYSRSDETHVFQAIVPAVPVLFVYLSDLERWLASRRHAAGSFLPRGRLLVRGGVALAALAYASTIAFVPGTLRLGPGEWTSDGLHRFDYHPVPRRRYEVSPHRLREIDRSIDRAARYIDDATPDGAEVLLLTSHELLNFLSHTRPAGGRYEYIFYLAKIGLIDRKAFEALVPAPVREALRADPPALVVAGLRQAPLLGVMPELHAMILERYHVVQRFGPLLIFARSDDPDAAPPALPMPRWWRSPQTHLGPLPPS
jgi:hypothetical protein